MEKTKNQISWTTRAIYVDTDTGEILDSRTATNKNLYTIIKKEKHATINPARTRGIIEYTKQCKRNAWRQLELS